jgi:hypothetical protein
MVVEGHHALRRPRQVGDDEADARIKLALMPGALDGGSRVIFSRAQPLRPRYTNKTSAVAIFGFAPAASTGV